MSIVTVETKPAGAGIVSVESASVGTIYHFADGNQIPSINRGILKPLSSTIGANTTYTIPTGEGTAFVVIPKAYLLSSNASTQSLIITTGVASTETVIIPISPNTDTITSNSLMLNLYIDSTGNVYSEAWQISGSNTNGSWIKFADGTMEAYGWIVPNLTIGANTAFGLPVQFVLLSQGGFNGNQFSYGSISWGIVPAQGIGTSYPIAVWLQGANTGYYYTGGNAGNYIYWKVIGRWK